MLKPWKHNVKTVKGRHARSERTSTLAKCIWKYSSCRESAWKYTFTHHQHVAFTMLMHSHGESDGLKTPSRGDSIMFVGKVTWSLWLRVVKVTALKHFHHVKAVETMTFTAGRHYKHVPFTVGFHKHDAFTTRRQYKHIAFTAWVPQQRESDKLVEQKSVLLCTFTAEDAPFICISGAPALFSPCMLQFTYRHDQHTRNVMIMKAV